MPYQSHTIAYQYQYHTIAYHFMEMVCIGNDMHTNMLAQGQTQGSTLQQRTNKTLTTSPFGNTCEADEVSPKVKAGVVAGLKCLQPRWDTYM